MSGAGKLAFRSREERALVQQACAQGWRVVRRSASGHLILAHPTGARETLPSAYKARALPNALSRLRRGERQ